MKPNGNNLHVRSRQSVRTNFILTLHTRTVKDGTWSNWGKWNEQCHSKTISSATAEKLRSALHHLEYKVTWNEVIQCKACTVIRFAASVLWPSHHTQDRTHFPWFFSEHFQVDDLSTFSRSTGPPVLHDHQWRRPRTSATDTWLCDEMQGWIHHCDVETNTCMICVCKSPSN